MDQAVLNYAIRRKASRGGLDPLGLPARAGLKPPADLAGDLSYPTTQEQLDKLIFVPPAVQVEHQSEWFAKVKEIMQS